MALMCESCWNFKMVMQLLSYKAYMPPSHAIEAVGAPEPLGCLFLGQAHWPEGFHELLKLRIITATIFDALVSIKHFAYIISFK